MTITMQLANGKALERLKNSGKHFNDGAKAFLSTAGNLVISQAKREAPVNKGQLKQSIQAKPPQNLSSGWEVKVGSGLEYAKYQEFGTGIYGNSGRPITPKRARVLAFRGKDGKMVFARSVRGVKKREFMKKGIDYAEKNIKHAFDALDAVIRSRL